MSAPEANWDVFCIHASADKEHARQFHEQLHGSYRVFLDDVAIKPGDNWQQSLDAALRASRVFTVLVSPNLGQAFYANEEMATAINLHRRYPEHRRVVPVLLKKMDYADELPYGLRSVQAIDAVSQGGMEAAAQK